VKSLEESFGFRSSPLTSWMKPSSRFTFVSPSNEHVLKDSQLNYTTVMEKHFYVLDKGKQATQHQRERDSTGAKLNPEGERGHQLRQAPNPQS
jgi:hypothetical protein